MPIRLYFLCFFLAIYLTLIILMAALGAATLLTAPGAFLFEKFHLAALYIPGVLFAGGLLLKSGRVHAKSLTILWLSPVPFLTLAIALQMAASQTSILVVGVLIEMLGVFPATALFFLIFAMEIIGFVKFATFQRRPDDVLFTFQDFRLKLRNFLILFGLAESEQDTQETDEATKGQADIFRRVLTGDEEEKHISTLTKNISSEIPAATLSEEILVPKVHREPLREDLGFTENSSEDDVGFIDISAKLDPQGTAPQGVFIKLQDTAIESEDTPTKNISTNLQAMEITPNEAMLYEEEDLTKRDRDDINQNADLRMRLKKYHVPVDGLLADYLDSNFASIDEPTRRGGEILEQTLNEFRIEARVTGIQKGPVITMYELLPSPGVKISSIVNLQDNIALRLAASRVRIVAPIPGKHAIGIEVPNKKRSIVSFSSLVKSEEFQNGDSKIPVILGKDISGGYQIIDLTRTPHLLIAGATGSGKSVCVNALIASILYSRNPQEVKIVMVDPKIVELKLYNDIPHLLTPVITDPQKALQALQWCLYEMERRYALLDSQGVRDMNSYNKRVIDRNLATTLLPYIVVIIDEFADLMATSGKELEGIVARLAAMSRAVGIHLVLATQRPSVDVITGLIKANFPSRIAFMVAGKTDSRIIIDTMGAEKLLGRGDMLFTSAWNPFPSRVQGAYLAEEEVERLTNHVKTLGEPNYIDEEMFFDDDESNEFQLESKNGDDPLYEKALDVIMLSRKASASYLQRRLKIGYNRAARLVEEMEHRGIVGPANGSKPREIIHLPEKYL